MYVKVKVSAQFKNGNDNLYLQVNGQEYYLFSQKHKESVAYYYSKGVTLDKAMDFTRARRDVAIGRTMEKLPRYIKSLEVEYNLQVLNKTRRKKAA